MKKLLTLLLAIAIGLSLAACGNTTSSEASIPEQTAEPTATPDPTPEPTPESTPEPITYRIGDAVETDILRITLTNAELAIKLNATSTGTYEEIMSGNTHPEKDYFTAGEYNPETDAGLAYVAAKGHTYVVIEYQADNLDRASVEFDGPLNSQFITVEYNGETYKERTVFGAESTNGYEWEKHTVSNVLLLAGKTEHLRCYIDIPVDAGDLSDDFYLTFSLPNSSGSTTDFRFLVNAEDRLTTKSQEISVDEAIALFKDEESLEYFSKHMAEYVSLSGEEISSAIIGIGKKWNVSGIWAKKFYFENDGNIEETIKSVGVGYYNNLTWTINEDALIIRHGEKGTDVCEVKSVIDGVYLLVKDGAPYAILQ